MPAAHAKALPSIHGRITAKYFNYGDITMIICPEFILGGLFPALPEGNTALNHSATYP